MKCARFGLCSFSLQMFSSGFVASSRRALHPGWKKPRRRLLSRAAGKLEEDNLFRIRKCNSACTISYAKTFQKLNIFDKENVNSEGASDNSIVKQRVAVGSKPTQKAAFKFAVSYRPGHGMACMRNQPEFNVSGCSSSYQLRMPRSNIPVSITMDQQYGNCRMPDGLQRARLKQINSITEMCVHNC